MRVYWLIVALKALLHPNTSFSPPGLIQKITDFLPMSTNFYCLYLTATKEPPQHYWWEPLLGSLVFPLFSSWLLCVCFCIGKDGMKKGECFVTFLCQNMWNLMDSPQFNTPWPTPCLLRSMVVEDARDQSWQDERWPCFFPPSVCFRRFTDLTSSGGNGWFFWNEVVPEQSEGQGTLPWWCQGVA